MPELTGAITGRGVAISTPTSGSGPAIVVPPDPDAAAITAEVPPIVPRRSGGGKLPLIVGGILALGFAIAVYFRGRSPEATIEPVPPPVAIAPDTTAIRPDTSAAAAVPAPDDSATAPANSVAGLALDSAALRSRPGVVGVLSSDGRGTGFLADTTKGIGLVATSISLVPGDSVVDVQVDGTTRLRGRVAATDRANAIAVVAIALEPWSGYRVLPIGGDTAIKGGDSLVALGSTFTSSTRRFAARAGSDGSGRPSLNLSRADAGRPVLSAASLVIALATQRGSSSSFANASAVDAAVRAAKARVNRDGYTPPSATVLPAWPYPSYSSEAVREASRKDTFDLVPYHAGGQGFRIFAMTPPLLAWRDSTIARTKAYWDSPFQLNKYPYELVDPIQSWGSFRVTISERRPVLVLSVVPDAVPEVRYKRFPDMSDAKNDKIDIRSARLVRDGQSIAALDSARIAAVVNPREYQDKKRPVREERLLVFRLDDFAKTGAYSVQVVGSNDGKPVTVVLPQSLLDAVRRDAARWRSGR